MARPRKDSSQPGARQRIIEAYWKQATQRAFEDISVDQILKGASCNRTTFYYHFENLAAVRLEAEKKRLTVEILQGIVALLEGKTLDSAAIRNFYEENLDLIRYLARQLGGNPQGDDAQRFRETVRSLWIEQGLMQGDGSDPDMLIATHTFLVGGLMSSVAALADLTEEEFLERLASLSHLYSLVVSRVILEAPLGKGTRRP